MFKDLGAPIREGAVLGNAYVAGPDKQGVMNTVYISVTQYEESVLLVTYNADTKETKQFRAENLPDVPSKQGAWGIALAGNRVYLGTYYKGHLLRYDIESERMTDLGNAVEGEEYIWSLAYDGKGKLYGGTFPGGKLFVMDTETEEVTDLGRFNEELAYCRYVCIANDGRVIASLGSVHVKIGIYNPATGHKQLLDFPENVTGFASMHQDDAGDIYFRTAAGAVTYRLEGDKLLPTDKEPKPKSVRLSGNRTLTAVTNHSVAIVNDRGEQEAAELKYTSSGLMMWMVHKGPDELIYGSSALPLRMFRYDPGTEESVNMGNPSVAGGEIYSMANKDGKLYIASYPGCPVSVYDPAKPWDFGHESHHNPRHIGHVGERQNRPTSMIAGEDGNLYIATIPDYGEVSGSLARLNPDTGTFKVWRGIAGEHSVHVLASIAGTKWICAGTSNEAGGGVHPPDGDAVLFIWDIEGETKRQQICPVPGAKKIVSIQYLDGLVYGLTGNGVLFGYDYTSNQVVWRKDLPIQFAIWPGMGITKNKIVYGSGEGKLFRYDIAKDEYSVEYEANGWLLGFTMDEASNKIYFTPGARLCSFEMR